MSYAASYFTKLSMSLLTFRVKAANVLEPAQVAELVDAQDLGSCAFGRGGSTPPFRTFR